MLFHGGIYHSSIYHGFPSASSLPTFPTLPIGDILSILPQGSIINAVTPEGSIL